MLTQLSLRSAGSGVDARCSKVPLVWGRPRSRLVVRASLGSLLASAVTPPTAPALTTALQFTPGVALAGGAVLGAAALSKWVTTGRVLGISGTVRGFLTGDWRSWRVAFLLGLLGGGAVAGAITPGAFDALPATYTLPRAALGGFLVGLGASLGNGCTSGHGICGNARMSIRSFVYTLTFMAAGAAAATLSGTAQALGVAARAAPLVWAPSDVVTQQGAMLLAFAALSTASAGTLARGASDAQKKVAGLVTELLAGCLFAFGLVYSRMVAPSKVAAFLSPLYPGFDATLLFVMAGALAVALPGFQWVARSRAAPRAPLCGGASFPPPPTGLDARLVAGGALFGAGWGLSGMCPGPALVALASLLSPPPAVAAFVAAMLAGMAADCAATGTLSLRPKPAAA